jgi:hypothetical protein
MDQDDIRTEEANETAAPAEAPQEQGEISGEQSA